MEARNTDSKSAGQEWAQKPIATYRSRLGDCEGFAGVLKAVLEPVAEKLAPQAYPSAAAPDRSAPRPCRSAAALV
ncbi:MAG: hypothetical protein AB1714_20190 [Acidobacteriota bacterium]